MNLIKSFRALIICEVVLFAAALIPLNLDTEYPEAVQQYLDASQPLFLSLAEDSPTSSWIMVGGVFFVILAAWIASLIGMWSFKRWARSLYVVSSVITLLMAATMGRRLTEGLDGAIGDLGMMVSGAIIAASFYTPVRERFSAGR